MFPSPLLLGLLASQTVSDTHSYSKRIISFCFVCSSSENYQAEIFCLNRCKFAIVITFSASCYVYILPSTLLQQIIIPPPTHSLSYFFYLFTSQPLFFHRFSLVALVLNQLPLPSPLPATTTKSLLYNGRIAEEVTCLLGCRDENLASQLAHGLNQVSTEHM